MVVILHVSDRGPDSCQYLLNFTCCWYTFLSQQCNFAIYYHFCQRPPKGLFSYLYEKRTFNIVIKQHNTLNCPYGFHKPFTRGLAHFCFKVPQAMLRFYLGAAFHNCIYGPLFTRWTDVLSPNHVKYRSREIGCYGAEASIPISGKNFLIVWSNDPSIFVVWSTRVTPYRCCISHIKSRL